jgi:hypothetical protein
MTEGFYGQQGTFDGTSDHNVIEFIVRQMLGRVRTGVPVKVIAVHGGGVGPAPTVDVQVLVNQIDGVGNQTPHGTIFGIPVLRIQGGANAVICDPVANDIGWLSIGDRDISAVKANKGKQSNPGSYRRHNLADGVYIGAILNPAAPTQYVQFTTTGLKIADKNGNIIEMKSGEIDITSTKVSINGDLAVSGAITAGGEITAGSGGGGSVTLQQHKHTGNNIPPTPGT